MSTTLKITLPFTPKAKAAIRTGKYGHYNPSAKGMSQLRQYIQTVLKDRTCPLFSGALLVVAHYRIPAAQSLPQWKRTLQHCCPHIKKPDGDNLEKFLNDALKGVVWSDDSIIAWLLRSKTVTHAREGQIQLFVRELDSDKTDFMQIIDDIREHIDFGD